MITVAAVTYEGLNDDIANLRERLARMEAKIGMLGTLAAAALGLNCAVIGGILALVLTGH